MMNSINEITKSIINYNNKKLQAIFEMAKTNGITCVAKTYWSDHVGYIVEVAKNCISFKDDNNSQKEFQFYFKDMDISEIEYCEETNKLYFHVFRRIE